MTLIGTARTLVACCALAAVIGVWFGEASCKATLRLDVDGTFRLRAEVNMQTRSTSGVVTGTWRQAENGAIRFDIVPPNPLAALPNVYFEEGLRIGQRAGKPVLRSVFKWTPPPLRWFGAEPAGSCVESG